MDLKSAVKKYLEVVKEFSRPMPLSRFGLSREELQTTLSGWEEDYQLHRHFELISPSAEAAGSPDEACMIHGIPYSSILFKESIRDVLE